MTSVAATRSVCATARPSALGRIRFGNGSNSLFGDAWPGRRKRLEIDLPSAEPTDTPTKHVGFPCINRK